MLQALRKRRGALYRWALLALAETAATTPWLITLYSLGGGPRWVESLPGAWLLLATYLAAAVWESGAPQDGQGGRRRIWAMCVGVLGVYAIAFLHGPAEARGSIVSYSAAMWIVPLASYLWYQGARSVAEGIEYSRYYERFTVQGVTQVGAVLLLVVSGTASQPRIQVMLYWSLLLLLGSGLTLLLLTRERALRAGQVQLGDADRSGETVSPLVTWMVGFLGAMTVLAGRVIAPEQIAGAGMALLRVFDVPFVWFGEVAMLIIVRWVIMVFAVLQFFARFLKASGQQLQPNPAQEGERPLLPEEWLREGGRPDLLPLVRIAVFLSLMILLGIWVYRLQRRWRADTADSLPQPAAGERPK